MLPALALLASSVAFSGALARHSAIALSALGLLAWPSVCPALDSPQAGSVPICVEYVAPPSCSQEAAFYAGVQGRTPRARTATPGEACLKVRVDIVPGATRVRGELRVQDQTGRTDARSVEGAHCEEVVDALALTLALAIDPEATLVKTSDSTGASSNKPVEAPASGAAAPKPEAPLNTPRTESPEPQELDLQSPLESATKWHLELGFEGLVANVLSVGLSSGIGVGLRVRADRGPALGLSLEHMRNDFFGAPERAEMALTLARLSACPLQVSLGALELEPCAAFMGGVLRVSGKAVAHPESVTRSWWSAGALGRGRFPLGATSAIELDLGATVPFIRRKYVFRGPERAVAETPTLAPSASVRFIHRF
ncbi:MAG TPA: hypothetical protein VFQ61_38415 [Polyangiaceae bacterium]|nr:hypothetical protein [Polyangiaceae bacterium]